MNLLEKPWMIKLPIQSNKALTLQIILQSHHISHNPGALFGQLARYTHFGVFTGNYDDIQMTRDKPFGKVEAIEDLVLVGLSDDSMSFPLVALEVTVDEVIEGFQKYILERTR